MDSLLHDEDPTSHLWIEFVFNLKISFKIQLKLIKSMVP